MKKKTSAGLQNSGTETRVQRVLSHPHEQSLGDPTCQVCNTPISKGGQITLYLYKPAGSSTYSIGQCRCHNYDDDVTALFTISVTELIATTLRLRSVEDTTTGRVLPEPSATNQSGGITLNYQPITARVE